jgi:cardiolipin synthase A/B
MGRGVKIALAGVTIFITLFIGFQGVMTAPLPTQEKQVLIYGNDAQDDLSAVGLAAIRSARKSIIMSIYALADKNIIQALNDQAQKGINLYLVCDAKASKQAFRSLNKKIHLVKRADKGLMHHKLMVIDETTTWMSSANMTRSSLRTYGNLTIGVYDPKLALYVASKIRQMGRGNASKAPLPPRSFDLKGQNLTFSFLPDDVEGADRVMAMIKTAKKTIKVAMYAWTRRDFTTALVEAHKRGVDVQVIIDHSMAMGMAKNIVQQLLEGGVKPRLSEGNALLHYKMMLVDGERLLNGSANWTAAAFKKNDDFFAVLSPLDEEQKRKMQKVWENVFQNSAEAD